jgi:hypothetical protein
LRGDWRRGYKRRGSQEERRNELDEGLGEARGPQSSSRSLRGIATSSRSPRFCGTMSHFTA